MKHISKNSKILSVSLNDFDAVVSQIILGHVFKDITYLNASFYNIDSIMESIEYDKYDFVFLTDISPTNISLLNLSENIILLDHHESAIEANNPSKMHFVISGHCAAYLTKKFVKKYYDLELKHLDDLVRLCDDYDMWNLKYPESKLINDLMFYRYRPKKFRELFFDGRITFTEDEQNWLDERAKEFTRLYHSLAVFEFEKINGCVVESKEFINEICDRLMSENEEKYEIVFCRNPVHGRVSIRHKIEGLNMGEILKNKGWGGGHFFSCGMFVNDVNDFKKKIEILEEIIFKHINNYKIL